MIYLVSAIIAYISVKIVFQSLIFPIFVEKTTSKLFKQSNIEWDRNPFETWLLLTGYLIATVFVNHLIVSKEDPKYLDRAVISSQNPELYYQEKRMKHYNIVSMSETLYKIFIKPFPIIRNFFFYSCLISFKDNSFVLLSNLIFFTAFWVHFLTNYKGGVS